MRTVERPRRRFFSSELSARPSFSAFSTMLFRSDSILSRIVWGRESDKRNVMKYVALSASQCGRRPRSRIVTSPKRGRDSGTAGGTPALLFSFPIIFGRRFRRDIARILQGRRNHISPTGPLAEIDQPATLTAEGELGIGILHRLLTGRTT